MRIDINSDLGESYGAWTMANDAALIGSISSANIACGYHAGDSRVMLRTVEACAAAGVAVGAHPGFPDVIGFGRRQMHLSPAELYTDVMVQIGALQAICKAVGVPLHHVKPHGAMYTMAADDYEMSVPIVKAVAATMDQPLIYAQPGSATARAATDAGVAVAHEIFADRAYQSNGQLASRSLPNAVLHDAEEIAARAMRMIRGEEIETIDGGSLRLQSDTICVHGDTAESVQITKSLRNALISAGFTISSQ